MQFCILFYLVFSTLQSNQYSLKCCEIMPKIGRFSQWCYDHWLDRKVENSRWNSKQNCIFYIYIILWYDQNSDTELEEKFLVSKILEVAKIPLFRCGSVFWWGKTRRNRSSLDPTQTPPNRGFGTVAHTRQEYTQLKYIVSMRYNFMCIA